MSSALIALWLVFASVHSGLLIPPRAQPTVRVSLPDRWDWDGDTDDVTGEIRISPRAAARPDVGCLLAHELTHYLQFRDLGRLSEAPAYRVEAACFRLMGNRRGEQWALAKAAQFSRPLN